LFSRYNKNPFLKRIEEKKNEYKKGKIEEWNEKRIRKINGKLKKIESTWKK